jgi:RNA polymerase sigma factor (TIGR02999 family)
MVVDTTTMITARRTRWEDECGAAMYAELRALAAHFFKSERRDHTLQPTALANEAYLRLLVQSKARWEDRSQLMGVAALSMRRILADHARRRASAKRGHGLRRVTLSESHCRNAPLSSTSDHDVDIIDLDEALQRLALLDERKCRVVELRFFGGLTHEQVADLMGVSRKTVVEDWTIARLWLRKELDQGNDS